jgi:hypothetical protein
MLLADLARKFWIWRSLHREEVTRARAVARVLAMRP